MNVHAVKQRGPYPVIIAADRYDGIYSGGQWIGFIARSIPPEAVGSDVETAVWWTKWRNHPAVAVGYSPDNVYFQLKEQSKGKEFPDVLPEEAFEYLELEY